MLYFFLLVLLIMAAVVYFIGMIIVKIPIIIIVISFVGGLIIATVIKMLFNAVSGSGAVNFSDLGDFFKVIVSCMVGIIGVYVLYMI